MKKKIDRLGRVVIPKPVRDALSIKEGSEVVIRYNTENKEIILKKEESLCSACGGTAGLKKIGRIFLCQSCIDQLKPQI